MIKVSQYNKYLSYNKNKLFLEDIALENLGEKFETPLYCYSVSQIEHNFIELLHLGEHYAKTTSGSPASGTQSDCYYK